ncbi:MAG: SDR family oxidoreductase [Promethearchaeota archaeon]
MTPPTKVLVVGASGFVGTHVYESLLSHGVDAVGTCHAHPRPDHPEFVRLDATQREQLERVVGERRVDHVCLVAALASPDACRANPELAWRLNAGVPEVVVRCCEGAGASASLVSTDYVFRGDKGAPYVEPDPRDPVNLYGQTKVAAEDAFLSSRVDARVVRISMVYGWALPGQHKSFVEKVVEHLRAGRAIRAFVDQWGTPTFAADVGEAVAKLLTLDPDDGLNDSRVVHVAGTTRASRYEVAMATAKAFGLDGAVECVRPVKREGAGGAPRPRDTSLSTELLKRLTGFSPRSLEEGLASMAAREPEQGAGAGE